MTADATFSSLLRSFLPRRQQIQITSVHASVGDTAVGKKTAGPKKGTGKPSA
ncbi:MAG: hypothetical protein TREMPRED_002127, partial [Tremellales sp. Tagirdzhanova-0007]